MASVFDGSDSICYKGIPRETNKVYYFIFLPWNNEIFSFTQTIFILEAIISFILQAEDGLGETENFFTNRREVV